MGDAGKQIRNLRDKLHLTQKEFGKMILVDSNTEAKWERQAKIPEGANKKKVEFLLELGKHTKLKEVISKTLSEGKIPAAAALIGLLFALWDTYGTSLDNLWPQLGKNSNLLVGVDKLQQKVEEHQKEGSIWRND